MPLVAVTDELIPVLWLTGPAGVGKSTVSWPIFTEVARAGIHVAFTDTDQLCMCYPAPPDDIGRQRTIGRAFWLYTKDLAATAHAPDRRHRVGLR